MGKEIKKNNNGFVGFLENLLLAKSVRHGFLLYFIIFNLDLILTLLGKGHIVKDLARIIPGIFFGTIETSLIENCVYKSPIYNAGVSAWWRFGEPLTSLIENSVYKNTFYNSENVSALWRFAKPLLFGFGVPIGFDVIQRWSIQTREFVKTKLKTNISQDALKEETNQTIIKLQKDIAELKEKNKNLTTENEAAKKYKLYKAAYNNLSQWNNDFLSVVEKYLIEKNITLEEFETEYWKKRGKYPND